MGSRLKIFGYALQVATVCWACQNKDSAFNPDQYSGHLALDSSLVLATVIAEHLEVPWDIAPGPNGWIWYTEQRGTISRVHEDTGEIQLLASLGEVFYRKSTGLLSMALHPDFEHHPYVFVHHTYALKDSALVDQISSRIVRLTFVDNMLREPRIILDSIPGNTFHNGSRMLIPDGQHLFLGLGDAGGGSGLTQNPTFLNGKILRLHLDGSIPADNPYPHSPVWSTGHRNVQGLAMGRGHLYATEHGPNNDDEVNIINRKTNYGWPEVQGAKDLDSELAYARDSLIEEPIYSWTPTVAPSDLIFYDSGEIPEWQNSLIICTLKGQSLRWLELSEDGEEVTKEHILFQQYFGRIRSIALGQNGAVYFATSNLDWHPGHQPWMYDSLPLEYGDRIIKLENANAAMREQLAGLPHPVALKESPKAFRLPTENFAFRATTEELSAGQKLYAVHCADCHRPDGKGNIGAIPPLVESDWVSGNTARLIDITLGGLRGPIQVNGVTYQDEMPAYSHLGDEEIAAILNFIRVEFGDTTGNIIAADVLHQRKGLR